MTQPVATPPGEQAQGRAADEPDTPAATEEPSLAAVLEAILLVADEPIPAGALTEVTQLPLAEVEAALARLAEEYERDARGFELRRVAGGWRYFTRAGCAPYVERWVLDGQQARLTQAALETLAIIAYRQPITRSRVGAIRGVNVDGVIRTLAARGLIVECGQDPASGGLLYRTTPLFLERLGLDVLSELPSLAPFLPELSEVEDDSSSS